MNPAAASVVARLRERGWSIAVAESLTGGDLVSALVSVPGVSAVLRGGIVAYDTAIKRSLLGVDARLLALEGPVHPEVAAQMAVGVTRALAVDGRAATVGISSTGVAGPEPQRGAPVGTVHLGFAIDGSVDVRSLKLSGDRGAIRSAAVSESLLELDRLLRE